MKFEVTYHGSVERGSEFLSNIALTYRTENRTPKITELSISRIDFEGKDMAKLGQAGPLGQLVMQAGQVFKKAGASGETVRSITMEELLQPFAGVWQVSWKAEDPDEDELAATVEILEEGSQNAILAEEDISGDIYVFNARNLPDGYYRVRVTVSDDPLDQFEDRAAASETSRRFLVDNTPPSVLVAAVRKGTGEISVSGMASDKLGYIANLYYFDRLGQWHTLYPEDGIADQSIERFSFTTEVDSASGTIVVKAVDQAGNVGFGRAVY